MKKAKRQLNKANTSNEYGKKLPYQTPKLQIYGTVSQLTSGPGGTLFDGPNPSQT